MSKEAKKEEKIKKTKKKKVESRKAPKEGFFKGINKELKQVKWPTFKEILKYTIATIIFCIIIIIFFELLNIAMAYVKGLFN